MATLIPTTGVPVPLAPAKGATFSVEELQTTVRGFFQSLRLPDGRYAFVNEDGKNLALPVNHLATALLREVIGPNDYIVGNVLVCHGHEIGEDTDDDDQEGVLVLD